MHNNDVLRRLRTALDVSDTELVRLAALGGVDKLNAPIQCYRLEEDDVDRVECPDEVLGAVLDGLVRDRRGPPPANAAGRPRDDAMTNNLVLKKLRIALQLDEAGMLAVLARQDMTLSKGELSALFRKPGHKHFRPAGDQLLRRFLRGLRT